MRLSLFATATLFVSSLGARADIVTFTYVGLPDSGAGLYENTIGTGSFSFTGPASTLSKADLSSFSFSYTFHQASSTGSFSYALANLTAFTATLSGEELLTLSLATNPIGSANPDYHDEAFVATSLSPSGANTLAYTTYFSGVATTTGQVSETSAVVSAPVAPTPEPSSFALLGTGLLGVAGMLRKRFA